MGRSSNPGGVKDFHFSTIVHTNSGAYLASYIIAPGGVMGETRPGLEADHSTSTSAEVKKT